MKKKKNKKNETCVMCGQNWIDFSYTLKAQEERTKKWEVLPICTYCWQKNMDEDGFEAFDQRKKVN